MRITPLAPSAIPSLPFCAADTTAELAVSRRCKLANSDEVGRVCAGLIVCGDCSPHSLVLPPELSGNRRQYSQQRQIRSISNVWYELQGRQRVCSNCVQQHGELPGRKLGYLRTPRFEEPQQPGATDEVLETRSDEDRASDFREVAQHLRASLPEPSQPQGMFQNSSLVTPP